MREPKLSTYDVQQLQGPALRGLAELEAQRPHVIGRLGP